ncbi:type IV toxin-antitoxin system AbiEi family antitoxin domain-containing protein [Demequina gelatinilytica]|uniref:type IV toxin-antitoxin system AbiEi family antitoxin domain-containing protein n=1 Tax=Demequina gelatinilytica TaxID=1638980 RepID=UPI0007836B4D|nr:type IV toxin-antitoxin system AbiEi family antitoxin domain-containing protein [Demequina gelatinilytica]
MDPVRALLMAGGAARWTDLADAGVSRGALLHAVTEGTVVRPHRGCFALPQAPYEEVDAVIFRGEPACVSVLAANDVPVLPAPMIAHIAVPDSRSLSNLGARPLDRVAIHRTTRYPLERMREVPIALDLASRCLPPAEHLAAIEGAIRGEKAAPDVIERFRICSEERRAWLLARLDLSSESPTETLARVTMRDAGLDVRTQVELEGVGRVDFVVGGVVVVECDGFSYHRDKPQFRRDRDRGRAATTWGRAELRYTYDDVVWNRDLIVPDVRATLWRLANR